MSGKLPRTVMLTLFLLFFVNLAVVPSSAAENLSWEKNLDAMTVHLNAVTFGNGTIVAVGEDGMIKTSVDGVQWTCRDSQISKVLAGVIWGKGQFVAVGFSGTIITSADGITWTKQNSGTENPLLKVIWDGGKYIAVGGKGTILTSSDGIHWKKASQFTTDSLFGIAYKEGMYIIVGENKLIRSSDGVHWTQAEFKKDYDFVAIDRNSSLFVATGLRYEGSERRVCILTSPDGVAWSSYELAADGDLTGIAYNGTQFVIVGTDTSAVSADGSRWSIRRDTSVLLNDVTYANGSYVGVGTDGLTAVSADGVSWTAYHGSIQCDYQDILWAVNQFWAAAGGGNCSLLTSQDGQEWIDEGFKNQQFNDALWNGSQYIVVGEDGLVLRSEDGTNWETTNLSGAPDLKQIQWNGQLFVVVGADGAIYTSPEGSQWTKQDSGTVDSLNGIAWNGSLFIAVGGNSSEKIMLASADGTTWTKILWVKESNKDFRGIIWANDQFLAFGSGGFLISSKDGTHWTPTVTGAEWGINDITWNGNRFYYVGDFGIAGSSADGINWSTENTGTTLMLNAIAWNGQSLLAAGNSNVVLTASPANIIKVEINDNPLVFDVTPITQNSRTLVPLRGIFEALGAEITWNDGTKTATATKGSLTMILKVGSKTALINGVETQLDTPAINYNGRILVPTRFIAESLGASVVWDPQTRTVVIKTK